MSIVQIVTLLSGLAFFLYGMRIMGEGLEKVAGDSLQSVIQSLTGNIFKGVLVGAGVTAIIQSSSATTVMVVGFVNAGIMTLPQAAAVIMGANIGTTVTAQILRLGDLQSTLWFMDFLKPQFLAPLAVICGVAISMIMKKQRARDIGMIVLGFGLLFSGMEVMSNTLSGLQDFPWFRNIFLQCQNPLTGVFAGTFVTAVIQSSSASVGILQALADSGAITYAAAIPIIMGQNIGTCVTALLSGVGASKNAKKAAMIHLYFNIIGSVVFLIIYTLPFIAPFRQWAQSIAINRGGIADVHLIFNIANTLMLLPFSKGLIYLANLTIGEKESGKAADKTLLDKRFLASPNIALSQCMNEVLLMFDLVKNNLSLAHKAVVQGDLATADAMEENENTIDNYETKINNYLMLIADKDITDSESKMVSGLFHTVTDLERIGDHAKNISEAAKEAYSKKHDFSPNAIHELDMMFSAVMEVVEHTYTAIKDNDIRAAIRIEPYEEVIDMFNHTLRNKHIERLKKQKCSVQTGVSFLDIITNLERIGDHCNNMALVVIRQNSPDLSFDPHQYTKSMETMPNEQYNEYLNAFEEKYYKPLVQ